MIVPPTPVKPLEPVNNTTTKDPPKKNTTTVSLLDPIIQVPETPVNVTQQAPRSELDDFVLDRNEPKQNETNQTSTVVQQITTV